MQTKATVVSVEPGFATVETVRCSACDGCHRVESGGCAMCGLFGDNRVMRTRVNDPLGALPGDTVLLETASSRVLVYAALVFLIPVLMTALGWLLGTWLSWGIPGQAIAAAVGFLVAFAAACLYSRRVAARRCDITITRILGSDHD